MTEPRSARDMGDTPVQATKLDPDKLRGGYYTPTDLADWIAAWCIKSSDDHVLEPSCGDGMFLLSAAKRLGEIGASPEAIVKQVAGVEIIEAESNKAMANLEKLLGVDSTGVVEVSDFFEWWSAPGRGEFDAVLGNPPFIRYQSFPEPHRTRAMEIMQDLGLKPNRLTNIWVPFVAAAVDALKPGGRMGLVLPAELLQVTYAAQLRTYLVERFSEIHVVACNELIFDRAEQEVVVLLAEGALKQARRDNECRVTVSATETRESLIGSDAASLLASTPPKVVLHEGEKWLKYFLTQRQIDLLRSLRSSGLVARFDEFASVDVGVVTGKNEFFVVSQAEVEEWNLHDFVQPLIGRTAHLSGAMLSRPQWAAMARSGERVYLLQLGKLELDELPSQVVEYVLRGEDKQFHLGYKCSIRKPWYAVPSVWTSDMFMFRQIYDFPRVIVNGAGATCTDTIHRVTLKNGDPETVAAMCFTSLTAASAEIEGRSYGGGVLELEPTEAERLLVPASVGHGLNIKEIDTLIRKGRIDEVIEINDKRILGDHLGLSVVDRKDLKDAWDTMRTRRSSRRRKRSTPGRNV